MLKCGVLRWGGVFRWERCESWGDSRDEKNRGIEKFIIIITQIL